MQKVFVTQFGTAEPPTDVMAEAVSSGDYQYYFRGWVENWQDNEDVLTGTLVRRHFNPAVAQLHDYQYTFDGGMGATIARPHDLILLFENENGMLDHYNALQNSIWNHNTEFGLIAEWAWYIDHQM
jgi:hypothetical protein